MTFAEKLGPREAWVRLGFAHALPPSSINDIRPSIVVLDLKKTVCSEFYSLRTG